MYNNLRTYTTLELDKILNMLSAEAALADAAEIIVNIKPENDITKVNQLLKNTYDAFNLSAVCGLPNFGRAVNISSFMERCVAGGSMNCKELLMLAETLRVIRSIKEWYLNNNSFIKSTSLDNMFFALSPNRFIEDKITFSIISEDEISDNASPELSQIRRKIASASADIRNKLDSIVKNNSKAKFLQESIVTQRDGRFVVPVKQEYRSEISGIVHDTSASGATLFVEPMAVVEKNNEIRVLKVKEKEEIERILLEISAEAANFSEQIISSYKILVSLSVIFAKASLAYKMKASLPNINNNGYIYLKNARHPLLDAKKAVPITVELGGEYRSLIITGPNTGGKTVSLKTVGLLTLMTMCGLMIPVDDNSSISVFDNILVDIGDEQSIEQSLSTFSSHMVNIIDILEIADDSSLVLLDELGGGTDPVEGAALARSILQELHNRYARIIATTHYQELKIYALNTECVKNASCEFDIDTLKPTYKLLIGTAGCSNAFAIARSLGISGKIISDAKGYISEADDRLEKILKELERERQESEKIKAENQKLNSELLKQKSEFDNKLKNVNAKCELILKSANEKANMLLEQTREKSNELLNSLEITAKKLTSENASQMLNKARVNAKKSLSEIEDNADPIDREKNEDYVLPRQLKQGDSVFIVSIKQNGTVSEINNASEKVLVSLGNLKTWVNISDLRLSAQKDIKNTAKKSHHSNSINISKSDNSSRSGSVNELDIRGYNAEEGIMELDRYIDHSLRLGIYNIAVIHGKGTGVLRSAVHSYLKKHSSVASFRLGTFGEGESGVTIIELK